MIFVFPSILIVLQICAAVVYADHENLRMAAYWLAAAVLTAAVTY